MTAGRTPSQTVGPFFGFALPFAAGPELVPEGTPDAIRLEGQVLDGAGDPVPDALVEIWQGDLFGRCRTDSEGVFHFIVVQPQPPYFEVCFFARGLLRHLLTRIYFAVETGDAVLDAVPSERRGTLVAQPDNGKLRFDIRLQGEGETVFFVLDATT